MTVQVLPPSPLGSPPGSSFWNDWYEKLRTMINAIAAGFDFSLITNKPTTLSGYGITDGQTKLNNSAGLAAALSDETGTGLSVFNTTPTLVSPVIGAATGTSVNISSTATASAFIPTGSAVPANGVYLPAANSVGIATNTTLAINIDSTGQVALQVVGKGFSVKEGSNAKQGKSAMTTGAVTVSTTAVTASSRIFISINDAGSGALTNIGSIYVNNIIAGTSFDIRSTNALDTSSVVWLITEPS